MRIGFITFTGIVFDAATPYKKPLGGSESAICYLAAELVHLEHEVLLFSRIEREKVELGVRCVPMGNETEHLLKDLDVLVVQNSPLQGFQMRPLLGKDTKLILWSQHAHDQPAVQSMHESIVLDAFDAFVVISEWQKEQYAEAFGIPKGKMMILRNAISPAFENMFVSQSEFDRVKKEPILAYTSTPFRGLSLLIQTFPTIRQLHPGSKLKIYSSMQVYQLTKTEDTKEYGDLYDYCKRTEGVEYLGSVSQGALAKDLRSVSCLAYPNTFAETSCISVMEAMAAGCMIVTSQLGALPETTADFGKLIPVTGNWQDYGYAFIKETASFLRNYFGSDRKELISKLYEQVSFVNKNYTWKVRAKEWDKWLKTKILTSK